MRLQFLVALGGCDAHKNDGLPVGFSQKTKLFTTRYTIQLSLTAAGNEILNSVIFVAYEAVFLPEHITCFYQKHKNTL